MRYQAISELVETLEPPTAPLPPAAGPYPIPESLARTLQRHSPERSRSDALCQRVYELEREYRKKQLADVLETVGDVPSHMLGPGIADATTFVDGIGSQVSKLPRLAAVHENQDDQDALQEYNALREQVLRKCRALQLVKEAHARSASDLQAINRLLAEYADPAAFFRGYHDELMHQLSSEEKGS